MLMESVHCGFIPNNCTLGTIEEGGCGPTFSKDIYASTVYSETGYASSPVHDSGYLSANYEDSNNNPFTYPDMSSYEQNKLDNSLLSGMSDMKVSDSSTRDLGSSPKTNKPKKNRSKTNKNAEPDRNRKDSLVYDVRLPDEQFLFFVPDMDLVKSHLMFAVREEVEVLKEKILELMDQIGNLERENSILRQYAPPDALQQIQQSKPQSGASAPGSQITHHGGSS